MPGKAFQIVGDLLGFFLPSRVSTIGHDPEPESLTRATKNGIQRG
tara:strand:+ start:3204 stop:3338 length:135 start_codon:yes stop_codon:yes gene_type:complete